jgi:hypothetical protein
VPNKDSGWPGSWLLLVFATIAPLIYFGPVLRSIEASAIDVYETIEAWILPIRIWFVG